MARLHWEGEGVGAEEEEGLDILLMSSSGSEVDPWAC